MNTNTDRLTINRKAKNIKWRSEKWWNSWGGNYFNNSSGCNTNCSSKHKFQQREQNDQQHTFLFLSTNNNRITMNFKIDSLFSENEKPIF